MRVVGLVTIMLVGLVVWSTTSSAGVASKAVQEVVEAIGLKVGARVLAKEVVEQRVTQVAVRYGARALRFTKASGHRGLDLIETLTEKQGKAVLELFERRGVAVLRVAENPRTLTLLEKFGDTAGDAMLKHPGIAADVIEKFGAAASGAMNALSEGGARKLAAIASDVPRGLNLERMLPAITKGGDATMDFIWRNKGALAVTAVGTAFISDPEPYISGAKSLLVEPVQEIVSDTAKQAITEVSKDIHWGWIVYPLAGLAFMSLGGIALLRRIRSQWRASAIAEKESATQKRGTTA